MRPPSRRFPRLALLLAALLTAATAAAQTLPDLLPEDVVAAFGAHGLTDQESRLRPFLDEAERLELFEKLGAALDGGEEPTEAVPVDLAGTDLLDLVGDEAWLAVSASPFRPLPALTLAARPTAEATAALAARFEELAGEPGVERQEEGGRAFWTRLPQGDEDELGLPIAYAATDGLAVLSTDREIVRAMLRRLGGADEPSMADGELYARLEALGEGDAFFLLDADPLAGALEPFAEGAGAGPLLARLRAALTTAGPTVSLVRTTDAGVESRGVLAPDAAGADPRLYALLTEGTAPGAEVLAFVPEGSVAVSAHAFDAAGWWAWLDDLLAPAAALGVPTATDLAMMLGVDVHGMLLDWMGTRVAQIQPLATAPVEAGVPQEGLLGSAVLLIEARDEAAAREGLTALLTMAGPTVGAFTSPDGGAPAMPETVQVAGTDVLRLRVNESVTVDTAVVDGWALLSFLPEATEAVLAARAAGAAAPAPFADAVAAIDAPVRGWSVSDDRAALEGLSASIVAQLQLTAGLGGAGGLDFEAVDAASEALSAWLDFVAERLGTSVSTTRFDGGELRSEGFTEVAW